MARKKLKKLKWEYELGSKISRKEAEALYELYKEHGSYAKVAYMTGRSDTAIANHIRVLIAEEKNTTNVILGN